MAINIAHPSAVFVYILYGLPLGGRAGILLVAGDAARGRRCRPREAYADRGGLVLTTRV